MLFNNARCAALTAGYVNTATGLDLQRFAWLNDSMIGESPLEWNWLVGEYPHNPDAKIVHYTHRRAVLRCVPNCCLTPRRSRRPS